MEKNDLIIGRTSATDRDPNTSDKFNFWITSETIVNPFDIVESEHVNNSKTYGLVTNLEHRTEREQKADERNRQKNRRRPTTLLATSDPHKPVDHDRYHDDSWKSRRPGYGCR